MNIAFLIRSLNSGGAERQLVTLAKGLAERGHRISVAVFYGGGPLEDDLRRAGVTILQLNKRGRWDLFGFLLRLVKGLKKAGPDILHGYLDVPNILTQLIRPLFPRTRIVWGIRSSYIDLSRYDWAAHLMSFTERALSRFTDLIIVNSKAGHDYARSKGFPESNMLVIHNGINTERFQPDNESRKRLRSEWGVGEGQKLIGLVGRLDPMKDHPNFLKAAALLAGDRRDISFVCVGRDRGNYAARLKQQGEALGLEGVLTWAGPRDDMAAVYNALDVLVSCSYGEGFPNVVGEAMACGVPCVVTDVGDSASMVSGLGEIVPPRNPEALKAAVEKILTRLERSDFDAEKSRQRVVDRFSVKGLVGKTEEVLLQL